MDAFSITDENTYSTKNTMASSGMPITASDTAPVPMVPAKNFFLLPFRSAKLPKNGISSASASEATVVA